MNDQHVNLESNEKYAKDIDLLKNEIVTFNDWPKPGVAFKYEIFYFYLYLSLI